MQSNTPAPNLGRPGNESSLLRSQSIGYLLISKADWASIFNSRLHRAALLPDEICLMLALVVGGTEA